MLVVLLGCVLRLVTMLFTGVCWFVVCWLVICLRVCFVVCILLAVVVFVDCLFYFVEFGYAWMCVLVL